MLHPTIEELSKNEFNRYELTIATAKCARILTDEYTKQREAYEKSIAAGKDIDRSLANAIDKDLKDENAIKNAISHFYDGRYEIYRSSEDAGSAEEATEDATEEVAEETTEAAAENTAENE